MSRLELSGMELQAVVDNGIAGCVSAGSKHIIRR